MSMIIWDLNGTKEIRCESTPNPTCTEYIVFLFFTQSLPLSSSIFTFYLIFVVPILPPYLIYCHSSPPPFSPSVSSSLLLFSSFLLKISILVSFRNKPLTFISVISLLQRLSSVAHPVVLLFYLLCFNLKKKKLQNWIHSTTVSLSSIPPSGCRALLAFCWGASIKCHLAGDGEKGRNNWMGSFSYITECLWMSTDSIILS